jgi:hypothetical protein
MKTLSLLFALFLHAVALGQGFTIRDAGFVGSTGGGTGGGSPGGGGGGGESAPPAPSFFWELDETSGNRVDSVASLALVPSGGGVASDTGKIGNAFKNVVGGVAEPSSKIQISLSTSLATDGSSLSFAWWLKPNSGSFPIIQFETYDSSDVFVSGIGWAFSGTTLYVEAWNDDPFDVGTVELASHPVRDGNWHLMVMVWDAADGKVKYSEDGAAFTESPDSLTLASDAKGTLYIRNANTNEYRVDLFAVWLNHAITASEASWIYNGGAGRAYADY